MLPKKIYLNYVNEDDEYKTWSEDPVHVYCDMQNREYTDLSQVWHNASIEPERNAFFIAEDNKGELDAYCWTQMDDDWIEYVCLFGLRRWAYMRDLLPKGGL